MRPAVDTDIILVRLDKLYKHLWGEDRIVYRDETCSILNLALFDILDLNSRPPGILLVRNEYLLAYDHILRDTFNKSTTLLEQGSATLVTGQPGIGKTLFLSYVLARRLHERGPVAFQINPHEFALFGQDGVSLHSTEDGRVPEGTWALSDSGVELGLCTAFRHPAPRIIHIIQTSPPSSCWKEWEDRLWADRYIMDVWSLEELRTLLALINLDFQKGKDLFEKYGPSPKIIIDILTKKIKEEKYESRVNRAAATFAGKFSAVFWELKILDFGSKIFTIRPKIPRECDHGETCFEIPTSFLCRTFGLAMSRQAAAEQHAFFRMLNDHPSFRDAGGWMFEHYAHNHLSKSECNTLEAYSLDGTVHHIPVPATMIAGSTALKQIQPPHHFYWRPVQPSFKGINAIIRSGDNVWALQYTISKEHKDAIDGLNEIRDGMNHKEDVKWHLVMVGLDLKDAKEARDDQKLGDWNWPTAIYASELPLGQFDKEHAQHLEAILNDASTQQLQIGIEKPGDMCNNGTIDEMDV